MADTFTPSKRSEVMGKVKQKNTGPEMIVRRLLHGMGYRFRLHRKDLPGTPDIVLPKYRTVIFVHGCFWHGHAGCRLSRRPADNADFWNAKLDRNIERDAEVLALIESRGWKTLIVWQCQTQARNRENLGGRLERFFSDLREKRSEETGRQE